MLIVVISLILLAILIYAPQIWVSRILNQYSTPEEHFPGTGGELALHLIKRFDLKGVKLEKTTKGDHYDPISKTVRLSPEKIDGKSLTAITVAAHEVGHAMQHYMGYKPFLARQQAIKIAIAAQKLGALSMMAIPLLTILSRSPRIGLLIFTFGIASMLLGTIVHLITLPVEWDASFKRALPILEAGGYLSPNEMVHAKKILTAAALTYVSGSLASLLNLARWISILKR
jgi:Zn-dependent membrane protease YugP